jgi:membrane-anchored glycerophosphoryl diester phosphodiesterase (GDPDase)
MFFYAGIVSVITGALSVFSLWSTNQAVLSSTDLAQGAAGDAAVLAQLALGIVTAVTSLIATGALVVSVSQSVIGQKVSLGQVWRAVRGRVWSLIGLSLLIVLIAIGFVIVTSIIFALLLVTVFSAMLGTFTGDVTEEGFMLVLGLTLLALALSAIPAFLIATRLSVSFSAVVLEKAGPGTAMSRSWRLTRGSTWRLIGLYILMAIIAIIVTSALGVPVALLAETLALSPGLSVAASALVGVVANLIVTPFTAGVLSLAYIDLRIRGEGLDVQLAQAAARA